MKAARAENSRFSFDAALLFPALLLTGIGVVMVYSASSHIAAERFGDSAYFLKKQAAFALAGVFMMVFCRYLSYRLLRIMAYGILGASFLLLGMVLVSSLGYEANGASRWLRLGGVSFQPSVFAKFALIVYLAYSLNKKKEDMDRFSVGFLPHVVVFGVFSSLILMQPDFGSVVIFGVITWLMLFVAGVRLTHLLTSFVFFIPAGVYYMVSAEYRMKRLTSFLDPWQFKDSSGYQIVHSYMAFGTGGFWGTGLGQGYQKLFYLPEPHTDFIFSVIGEELGLLGVMFIMFLFMVMMWRGLIVALQSKDRFGALLALGLTAAIGFQVFVNTGVTLGLLPTKGITLPFLSYGGTSLLFNLAAIGVLMNIGQKNHES